MLPFDSLPIAFAGFLALGAIVGTAAGLLGIGGGLVVVPALSVFFGAYLGDEVAMHLAVGTSLATIIITSLASGYAHHQKDGIRWDLWRRFAPGIVLGALIGGLLARYMDGAVLRGIFAAFALLVAVRMAFAWQPDTSRTPPAKWGMSVVGTVIGLVSALVGVGGGSMTVPYLSYCNIPMRQAVGTSSAVGFPLALVAATGYIAASMGHPDLPDYCLGYVYLPAFLGISVGSALFARLGAKYAHRLPQELLKRIFSLFLFAAALKLLF
ncbi:sulfite exporter TauE/SafE family protein [Myxococcota bacterium]|nr:sulfite exporter TauE/SafE family protein [Myxococcota bacterium]